MGLSAEIVFRRLPDFTALLVALLVQWRVFLLVTRRFPACIWVRIFMICSILWTITGFVPVGLFPYWGVLPWVKAGGFAWAVATTAAWLLRWGWIRLGRAVPQFDPGRRQALNVIRTATLAAPAATLGYGVLVGRRDMHLREVEIPIRGLHKDLHGLRMVQITDIHLGPFFEPRDLEWAIGIANEANAHVALVTGDLVTARRDPLEQCIHLLKRLKAGSPILGCLGNHEIHAACEDEAEELGRRAGMAFLRSSSRLHRFGQAGINFVGVDYQPKFSPYLVGAEKLVAPGVLNVLLSHNPDVFPVAAAKGFDLTIAGHTHGGQITVEILGDAVNFARFYTPYVYGRYEQDGKFIYVSRGLGTVGMPVRVGAPPEVSLIKLCAT
ncbi:MAG: metallophosphoesterase [Bryobacterales bacterium]|nr:metallophosphoesterase [Bryobacterales bacterium]